MAAAAGPSARWADTLPFRLREHRRRDLLPRHARPRARVRAACSPSTSPRPCLPGSSEPDTCAAACEPAAARPTGPARLPDRGHRRLSSARSPHDKPRALIQMATGAGKTFTACTFIYRLIKLRGRQAHPVPGRSQQPRRPDAEGISELRAAGRRPHVHRDLHRPASARNRIDPDAKVVITTIQRLYAMLRGRGAGRRGRGRLRASRPGATTTASCARSPTTRDPDRDLRLHRHRRMPPLDLRPVAAGAGVLRCLTHRPDRHALEAHARLLQPEPGRRISLRAVRRGRGQCRLRGLSHPHRRSPRRAATWSKAGFPVPVRDRRTRAIRYEQLDEDLTYAGKELDRSVTVPEPDPHGARRATRTGSSPISSPGRRVGAQDPDLRQGRQPRRGDRPARARGLRRGQRLRQEDHLPDTGEKPEGADQGLPRRPRSRASPSPWT